MLKILVIFYVKVYLLYTKDRHTIYLKGKTGTHINRKKFVPKKYCYLIKALHSCSVYTSKPTTRIDLFEQEIGQA